MDNLVKEDEDDPYKFCDWAEAKKVLLMMYPTELIDEEEGVARIDYASDEMLSSLSPELRECIINNEFDSYQGDVWKSDAYSFGLILLQVMLLKHFDWLVDLT